MNFDEHLARFVASGNAIVAEGLQHVLEANPQVLRRAEQAVAAGSASADLVIEMRRDRFRIVLRIVDSKSGAVVPDFEVFWYEVVRPASAIN